MSPDTAAETAVASSPPPAAVAESHTNGTTVADESMDQSVANGGHEEIIVMDGLAAIISDVMNMKVWYKLRQGVSLYIFNLQFFCWKI